MTDNLLEMIHTGCTLLAPAALAGYTLFQCGGGRKKDSEVEKVKSGKETGNRKAALAGPAKPNGPKAPADKNAMAGTHDPNYQTLAGVENVFDKKPAGAGPPAAGGAPAPGAPKPGGPGMAATHDPNYQTLAGIGNDCFEKKDGAPPPAGGAAAPGAPKPGGPGMAATHDPNYQTLAGIGNDCFDKK